MTQEQATISKAPTKPKPVAKTTTVKLGAIQRRDVRKIGVYGPGGIGKTTLACTAPGPVAFFDLENSLSVLADELKGQEVRVVQDINTWQQLRDALNGGGWDDIKTIVIDSASKAEDFAIAHTLLTVPDTQGNRVSSVEGYGYGKGYQYVYETFLYLLADLDKHITAGRNVMLVMHDCTANVPNPGGDDWIRSEPRLQDTRGGKASIRLRVRDWLDDLLFIAYDVAVSKEGKGQGSGTRTVWPNELPHFMAKTRSNLQPMPIDHFSTAIWDNLFSRKGA